MRAGPRSALGFCGFERFWPPALTDKAPPATLLIANTDCCVPGTNHSVRAASSGSDAVALSPSPPQAQTARATAPAPAAGAAGDWARACRKPITSAHTGAAPAGAAHIVHGSAAGIAHPHAHGVAFDQPTAQLSRMSLLVPVFTAVQKRVASTLSCRRCGPARCVGQDVAHDEGGAGIQRRAERRAGRVAPGHRAEAPAWPAHGRHWSGAARHLGCCPAPGWP
jgi:hypothetical protein